MDEQRNREFKKAREDHERAIENAHKPENKEITMDTWRCKRCVAEFERERGDIPFECDGCGRTSNKTAFEALSGPYQYFDLHGRKRFAPKRLGDKILEDDHFITRRDSKEMYRWEDNCYQPRAEDFIKERAQELLGDESVRNRKEEVVGYIRDETLVEPEEIDKEDNLIAVENGILNTAVPELIEPDPERHFLTQKIPIEYNPESDFEGSKMEEFLHNIFHEEDINTIQRFQGTTLIKNYDYKKSLVLVGPSNSGKSTFLDLVFRFLGGSDNVSNRPLEQLANNKFSRGDLIGKLANISAELNSAKEVKGVETIQQLTGGDPMGAPIKHVQGERNFTNFAKLMFSCNKLPKLKMESLGQAWWNRWIIITVDKNIFNPRDEDTIRKEKLLDELIIPKETQALLNWALDGLKQVSEEGHFNLSEQSKNGKEKWMSHDNNLRAFVDRFIEVDPDGRIVKQELYDAYTEHIEEEDLGSKLENNQVGNQLPKIEGHAKDGGKPKIHYIDSHRQVPCWEGIKFKDECQYSHLNRSIENPRSEREENKSRDQTLLIDEESD